MNYIAPVSDMLFNLRHIAKLDELAQLPGLEDASLETAQAVLNECAKFTQEVVAPLNHSAGTIRRMSPPCSGTKAPEQGKSIAGTEGGATSSGSFAAV